MTEKKKTLKERRQESDERIIASAMKIFGEKGYTYSSIRDIASGAGVTSGLITQRYGTKDNLFKEAYIAATSVIFSDIDINTSPRECLCTIIHDIERLADERPDAFRFCYMIRNSSDYPRGILGPYIKEMMLTNSYKILQEAQKRGMLPAGNLDTLLASFSSIVFYNVNLNKRYNMEVTPAEKYLEWIHFSDTITQDKENWFRVLETAIANTFDALVYANLETNTGDTLICKEPFNLHSHSDDIKGDIETAIDTEIPEKDRERVREYFDFNTLPERLKGRKSLSAKFPGIGGITYTHTFLPISWDEGGRLKEVLAGMYRGTND